MIDAEQGERQERGQTAIYNSNVEWLVFALPTSPAEVNAKKASLSRQITLRLSCPTCQFVREVFW